MARGCMSDGGCAIALCAPAAIAAQIGAAVAYVSPLPYRRPHRTQIIIDTIIVISDCKE